MCIFLFISPGDSIRSGGEVPTVSMSHETEGEP